MQKPLAEVAAGIIIQASSKYRASLTAKYLGIAFRCKNEGLEPLALAEALIKDATQMELVTKAGIRVHKQRRVEVEITPELAQAEVAEKFAAAQEAMPLSIAEMRALLRRYKEVESGRLTPSEFEALVGEELDKKQPASRSQDIDHLIFN